jgi:TonB-dependent SusC/RagA subfamily outer membrane receptor
MKNATHYKIQNLFMHCKYFKKSKSRLLLFLLAYTVNVSAQINSSNTSSDSLRPFVTDTINILYGRQPVSQLLQSTGTVYNKQLVTTPSPTFLIALQGRLAGANILQTSGLQGRDGSGISFSLRGQSSPLILIDGVPRGFSSLDPEEVESITVLKDALSTVLLGQRASNGVVLVTTKKGKVGTPRISFTAQSASQSLLKLPQTLSSFDYATLYNEALLNDGKQPAYTQSMLDAYKNGTDPINFPNTDWYETILKKHGNNSRYNLNMEGGSSTARYFVSLDYMNQKGFFNTTTIQTIERDKTFAVYRYNAASTPPTYQRFGTDGDQTNDFSVSTALKYTYTELTLGYDKSLGRNNLNAIVIANQQIENSGSLLPANYSTLGTRLSYNIDEKYFAEGAVSYSGYNRFKPGNRFGFFPAIGIGWNIAKENFINGKVRWINNLKLRANYGRTGNAQVGYYVYNQYFEDAAAYVFGATPGSAGGVEELTLANPKATWEKSR